MELQNITTTRWQQVKDIFQTAIELPTAERPAWLKNACDDAALLAEVESLIAAHEQPGSFLDGPAADLAGVQTDSLADPLVGQSLGRYQILATLGRGGMGQLYRAKDTTLGREVAIKVLLPTFSINQEWQERLHRFAQEARAASALNHPNIITIHEFGQENGTHFIVSEFIEGETLRQRLANGALNAGEVLDIAIQIVGALEAAHKAGIFHRDIKPENIMVRPDGLVKILDFGLAKLVERKVAETAVRVVNATEAPTADWGRTEPGVVMGTICYMSPEQARGQELDGRTDIFSLGIVLYEMAAGRTPFTCATAADAIASILAHEPPPIADFAANFPNTLETVIRRMLSKDRERRYQLAGELVADLKSLKSGETAIAPDPIKRHSPAAANKWRWRAAAIVFGLLLAAVAGLAYYRHVKPIESIAVLPFSNTDGNPETEYLADGLTESVINSLSRLSGLEVRPRNSVFRYKKPEADPLAAGRELDVEAVLTAQVTQRNDELVINLQLVDVRENRQLWGMRHQRKLANILSVQEEIARDVSENLRLRLSSADEQQLAKRSTNKDEAFHAYWRGRYYWNQRSAKGFNQAAEHFNQAIAIDPGYALAWAGLADSYLSRAAYGFAPKDDAFPKGRAAAKKALELDDSLAEAYTSLANIAWLYDWDSVEAEKLFKQAIALNRKYPTARQWYALQLSALGRHDDALAEIKLALKHDPLSTIIEMDQARVFYFARQYDQAIAVSLKVLQANPDFESFNHWLRLAYEQTGQYDKAFEESLKIQRMRGASQKSQEELRQAYSAAGWKGYWRLVLDRVEKGDAKLSPYFIAGIYARLSDRDQAMKWLRRAYDQRADFMLTIRVDPVFDGFQSDQRFTELLRQIEKISQEAQR